MMNAENINHLWIRKKIFNLVHYNYINNSMLIKIIQKFMIKITINFYSILIYFIFI